MDPLDSPVPHLNVDGKVKMDKDGSEGEIKENENLVDREMRKQETKIKSLRRNFQIGILNHGILIITLMFLTLRTSKFLTITCFLQKIMREVKETIFCMDEESTIKETQESDNGNHHKAVLDKFFDKNVLEQGNIDKSKELDDLQRNEGGKIEKNSGRMDDEEEISEDQRSNDPNLEELGRGRSKKSVGDVVRVRKRICKPRKKRSLIEIQGAVGVTFGRKKITKRRKKRSEESETKHCSDTSKSDSITDSDIRFRNQKIMEEARVTIEVGKLCGMNVIGEEDLLVQILVEVDLLAEEKVQACNYESNP